MVGNTKRSFEWGATLGYQVCGVVLCRNESLASCGQRAPSETTFTKVEITGTFVNRENLLVFPSSANSTLLPLNWTYKQKVIGDTVEVKGVLNEPAKDVLTLSLFARKFEKDVVAPPRPLSTPPSYAVVIQTGVLILLVVVSIGCYVWYHKRCGSKSRNEVVNEDRPYQPLQELDQR